jgi:glycosyltransferase involved in cell wall biosynthesis
MIIPWRPKHNLQRILNKLNPHVIHIHHPFLLGPMAISWAKNKGIKTLFTYHTIYEKYLHYVPLPAWLLRPLVTRWVLHCCRSVDQIIVPSSGIKNYLSGHGITHSTIIPSGLQELFLEQPLTPKKLQNPYRLLYVGRFVSEKNIPFLFDLLVQLPDSFFLTLVGYGEQLDFLKHYAYEMCGLSSERVQFIIKPNKQTLRDYYLNAHLFLFPSQSDTQGLVLVESMACSTPVIALDGVGQRDLIKDGANGFLVHNLDEMREMILRVVSDDELYKQLQQNSWQTAQAYDPKKLVERIIALYDC